MCAAAQAHECRFFGEGADKAGNPIDPTKDIYDICVGFKNEERAEGQPGQGKLNNLDFFPVYYDATQKDDPNSSGFLAID